MASELPSLAGLFSEAEISKAIVAADAVLAESGWPIGDAKFKQSRFCDELAAYNIKRPLAKALIELLIQQNVFSSGAEFENISVFNSFGGGDQVDSSSPDRYLHSDRERWLIFYNQQKAQPETEIAGFVQREPFTENAVATGWPGYIGTTMNTEKQQVISLRFTLERLHHFGKCLLNCEYETSSKLERGTRPVESDYELASSRKKLDDQLCQSWPAILRRWKNSLLHWWVLFDAANKFLCDLPKHLVDDTTEKTSSLTRWSVRLQKLLIELGQDVSHTRKRKKGSEIEISLGGAIEYRLPSNWLDRLNEMWPFRNELEAIELSEVNPPEADANTTKREFVAICKEAIVRIGEANPNNTSRLGGADLEEICRRIGQLSGRLGFTQPPIREIDLPDATSNVDGQIGNEIVQFTDPFTGCVSEANLRWVESYKGMTVRHGIGQKAILRTRKLAVEVLEKWIRYVSETVVSSKTKGEENNYEKTKGVSLRDVVTFINEEDPDGIPEEVKRWSDSKKITATKLGKCSIDGRADLYELSELLSDSKNFYGLSSPKLNKLKTHLLVIARPVSDKK